MIVAELLLYNLIDLSLEGEKQEDLWHEQFDVLVLKEEQYTGSGGFYYFEIGQEAIVKSVNYYPILASLLVGRLKINHLLVRINTFKESLCVCRSKTVGKNSLKRDEKFAGERSKMVFFSAMFNHGLR